jgi:hypothetical protein
MPSRSEHLDVYLEIGKKRVFAGAIDWPGWCRGAIDEQAALQSLFEYSDRYARALPTSRLDLSAPSSLSALRVVERLKGDATTDFGAPSVAPPWDSKPVNERELARLVAVLKSFWHEFDRLCERADGRELAKGARGGGRDLAKIREHVLGADQAYLSRLAWKHRTQESVINRNLGETRQAILMALESGVRGELPAFGPRGGKLWTVRYFVRRVAWHVLDHAWEIEDRAEM